MPEHYVRKVFWSDEDGCYIAIAPAFAGLSAFGNTPADAIAEFEIPLKAAIEIYEREGWPLPPADSHTQATG